MTHRCPMPKPERLLHRACLQLSKLSHLLLMVAGLWLGSMMGCSKSPNDSGVLTVYCAASLQKPLIELAGDFEQRYAIDVQLQFGGTSMLVNQANLTNQADVLISADQFSTDQLFRSGECSEYRSVAIQVPVIATTAQAASKVLSRADLFHRDVKLGLGSIEATSIGKATEAGLGSDAEQLFSQAVVSRTTVTALATDLKVGSLDAAIVWDSTAFQFQLDHVVDQQLAACEEVASACVMSKAAHHQMAQQFVSFLADSEHARRVFSEHQFQLPNVSGQQELDSE